MAVSSFTIFLPILMTSATNYFGRTIATDHYLVAAHVVAAECYKGTKNFKFDNLADSCFPYSLAFVPIPNNASAILYSVYCKTDSHSYGPLVNTEFTNCLNKFFNLFIVSHYKILTVIRLMFHLFHVIMSTFGIIIIIVLGVVAAIFKTAPLLQTKHYSLIFLIALVTAFSLYFVP